MAILACVASVAALPAPAIAQGVSVNTLKELQKERVALARRLTPSVLAVAANRPDMGLAPNTGMAGGGAKANTGFAVDDDYVITCGEASFAMMVTFKDGRRESRREVGVGDSVWLMNNERKEFGGKIVGKDQRNLILVIKMEEGHPKIPSLKLANSDEVEIGSSCVGLGNSLDTMLYDSVVSFSYGTVSGFYRFEPVGVLDPDERGDPYRGNMIESDTAIHPGDHGGPICNLDGDVIAMMTGHFMAGRHLGTSVPANQIRAVLPQLKKGVKEDDLPQAWCGFKGGKFDRTNKGVVVSEVNKGGPGEKAGLKKGMILLRVDNYKIPSKARLAEMLGKGRIMRKTRVQDNPFVPPREVEVPVSYGLPIGTHILLTVLDLDTGKEKTVDLLTEQKEEDY
ncbi:MAG: serine protease [Planctomycetes bacterium]|nr:serine protease [Planctomycetota bacterium]